MPSSAAVLPPDLAASHDLLRKLLDISVSGLMLLRPVYAADGSGAIVDLAYEQLNPAAQRLLHLPACPSESLLTLYPDAAATGVFAFCRDTFLSGQPGQYRARYAFDGLDSFLLLSAQRSGERLLVSFGDAAEQARPAAEEALRASQAREQAARAEAEAERRRLHQVLRQMPANIALLSGPEHVYELVNPEYERLFPARTTLGRTLREVIPELEGQGFYELFDRVYQTGEPFYDAETEAWADFAGTGELQRRYYRTAFEPIRNAQGEVTEVLNFAVDVTAQVEARRQVEQLHQAAQAARAEAEAQRQRFYEVLMQLPAQVATYHGPEHVFSFVNPRFSAFVAQRDVLGRPLREVAERAISAEVFALFDQVYATGQPVRVQELEVNLAQYRPGRAEPVFVNASYHPLRNAQGRIDGILDFSYDVTEQVLARRQAEQLNQELEARVRQRTQELDRQQGQLQEILGQVPAAIATLTGPEHRYSFFNDRYQAISAGRAELGRSVAEVYPEVVEQGFVGLLDQVYATGQPFVGAETPAELFNAATGRPERHYVDFIYQPLLDEQGQTTGILAFVLDVTERVQARRQAEALQAELLAAARRQAQERATLYQVFEQTPALVALFRGPTHRYEYANPAFRAAFPGRELLGRPLAEILPEIEAQGFGALLDRVYQTGETYFGTEQPAALPATAGQPAQTRYFSFTYQAYQENGQTVGVSNFAYDVTEQVLARQEREAQRQQLQQVFEQAPVAIFVLRSPAYLVDVVNAPMSAILGHSPQQLLGRPYFEAVPELAAQGYQDLLDEVWRTGRPHVAQEREAWLAHYRPGEKSYFNFVYQPVRDEQGQPTGIICVTVDVTEQVRARQQVQALNEELAAINGELTATNEELQESNRQLTRTNIDLDTFVYTASHDLKAPITNIEGIALALRDTLPAAVREDELVAYLLELLNSTVARFQFTIAQLTDISKLQLAHAGPAEPVRLAQVVEAVGLDLAPAIGAAQTRLTIEVAPELVVSFPPANLRSVVYNLLSNAVKYRAPDRPSQVRVRAYPPAAGQVVLEVEDNGLGLSKAQQRQLFGLFQRLHTHVEGTGVGLYISKRLIENAGGRIAVRSQPGAGTTFTVTLPA